MVTCRPLAAILALGSLPAAAEPVRPLPLACCEADPALPVPP